jgi:hypothetical protein
MDSLNSRASKNNNYRYRHEVGQRSFQEQANLNFLRKVLAQYRNSHWYEVLAELRCKELRSNFDSLIIQVLIFTKVAQLKEKHRKTLNSS